MTKSVICECGQEKEFRAGVAVCSAHCERPCLRMPGTCTFCLTYSARTNNRVSLEYGAEKRRNGR